MSQTDPYAAHAAFVAKALPAGRPLLVVAGSAAWFGAFLLPFWAPVFLGAPPERVDAAFDGATPGSAILVLGLFALPIWALGKVLKRTEGRRITDLFGDGAHFWRQLAACLRFAGLMMLFVTVLLAPGPELIERLRPVAAWLALLPFALVAITIQCAAEELFYRGYLQQRLAALSRSPVVWMGIPSLIFALSHVFNASHPVDIVFYITWTFIFGLMAADVTARSGTLAPAIAMHVINNATQMLSYAPDGAPMSGLALILMPWDGEPLRYLPDAHPVALVLIMVFSLLPVVILWLATRIAIRR